MTTRWDYRYFGESGHYFEFLVTERMRREQRIKDFNRKSPRRGRRRLRLRNRKQRSN